MRPAAPITGSVYRSIQSDFFGFLSRLTGIRPVKRITAYTIRRTGGLRFDRNTKELF
jgi:hypothetical protein